MPTKTFDWNDVSTAALLKLVNDKKHSAKMIAVELGGGCTRNAVLGKLHRLGVTLKVMKPEPPKVEPPVLVKPAAMPEVRPPKPSPRPIEPAVMQLKADGSPIPLLKIRERECRWPIGDPGSPDFGFCGKPVPIDAPAESGRSSYCAHHAAMVFIPSKPMKPLSPSARQAIGARPLQAGPQPLISKQRATS